MAAPAATQSAPSGVSPTSSAAATAIPPAPTAAPAEGGAAPATDEALRAKRPARIPRSREEGATAEADEAAESVAATGATPGQPAEAGEMPPLAEAGVGNGAAGTAAQPAAPAAPAEEEAGAGSANSPAEALAGGYLDDGLSWPLPPSIIVGGRYRVEAVVSVAPTVAGENVYRAKDLQGFERCWSCGATYEMSEHSVPEQFCRECGADMLGRPYILRERLLREGEEPAEALPGEQVFVQGKRRFSVEPEEAELPPFPLGAHVVIASASDIGRERAAGQNEDGVGQLVVQIEAESRAEPLALAIVADGLGGHASGREASRMVVRTVLRQIVNEVALPLLGPDATPPTKDALKQALRDAISAANDALQAANDASKRDMGSTVVATLIYEDTALVANVGDSRAYVFDGGTLRRLTADHSLVEQLVAGGMIEPEERYTHPSRNQIFRSLGVGAERGALGVDLFTQRLRPRMRLLLCSDGLWEMVHDEELARILRETPNPQAACDALIRAANEHGGEDNVSALVVEISG